MGNSVRSRQAFTVFEVLMAMGVAMLCMGMVALFMKESFQAAYFSEKKNILSAGMRNLTAKMAEDARQATYFKLYPSFASGDRNAPADALTQGQTGNFLLLVYASDTVDSKTQLRGIEKIIGYFFSVDAQTKLGALYQFSLSFTTPSYQTVEQLIPSESQTGSFKVVLSNCVGIGSGKVFYDFNDKSIMVHLGVFQGKNSQLESRLYNFTLTPRGL